MNKFMEDVEYKIYRKSNTGSIIKKIFVVIFSAVIICLWLTW